MVNIFQTYFQNKEQTKRIELNNYIATVNPNNKAKDESEDGVRKVF